MKVLYSDSDARHLLRNRLAENNGKQAALASEMGCSGPYLSAVPSGKAPPGPKILKLLGLEKVRAYDLRDDA